MYADRAKRDGGCQPASQPPACWRVGRADRWIARDCRERRAPRGLGVQLSYAKLPTGCHCRTPGQSIVFVISVPRRSAEAEPAIPQVEPSCPSECHGGTAHPEPTDPAFCTGKKGAGHDKCALARMRERNGKPRASSRLRTTVPVVILVPSSARRPRWLPLPAGVLIPPSTSLGALLLLGIGLVGHVALLARFCKFSNSSSSIVLPPCWFCKWCMISQPNVVL